MTSLLTYPGISPYSISQPAASLRARKKFEEFKMETAEQIHTITVAVNNRPVNFTVHKVTGAEIKAAAISQGVPIQQDFQLFEIRGGAPLKPIMDGQVINLHEKQEFRATAPDDNS
jgi:Multiubiquitin